MSKEMIVKVQVPLMTNEDPPLALIYNKDRSFEIFMLISDDIKRAMGKSHKKFFFAKRDKHRGTVLTQPAPWQDW